MDSSRLTLQQARQLQAQIRRELEYLGKLRRRMEVLGFPPSDPLYAATMQAYNAVHELHVRCHYAGCASGVGRADSLHGEPKRRVEPRSMWRTTLQA